MALAQPRRATRWLAGVAAIVLLTLQLRAHATTNDAALGLEALASASDAVIVARVIEQRSAWIDRALYTFVELSVEARVKGETSETIELRIPGGQAISRSGKVRIAEVRANAPAFFVDTEAVFFLKQSTSPGRHTLVDLSQGHMPILDRGGQRVVQLPLGGEQMTLTELTRRVRDMEQDR